MKPAAIALALACAFGSTAALAVDVPSSSRYDNRIQYVNYNPGDVVLVRALPGLGARLVFGPDEEILDVASGFSQGWEFSDRRNILYVKPKSIKQGENQILSPKAGDWDTNLMVTTNKRMYDFDLKLMASAGSDGKPVPNQRVAYRVQFLYPGEARAKERAEERKRAAQAKLDVTPPPMNWHYSMQIGDKSEGIAPTMAYDDGRFTYLRFPNNRDFPAAFIVAADKTESLVNSHIDPNTPDVLVIHRVSPELVLRLGNAVVGVYNESYDPDGLPPTNGTTVPGVQRVIKSGEEAK
ncbi:P-type conjugative transfer protein VirB9 [Escherichia coli]